MRSRMVHNEQVRKVVFELLNKEKVIKTRDVYKACDYLLSRSTVLKVLKDMEKEGLIERIDCGNVYFWRKSDGG